MRRVLERLEAGSGAALERLFELLRVPSVSSDPARTPDVHRAARWLERYLGGIGLAAELVEAGGHPAVLAEWRGSGGPTVLVYGHYDVQPAARADGWSSEPFAPELRGGRLYARGATDDKGQLFAQLSAIEAWLGGEGRLPVDVVVLVEGEEEIGSPSLGALLAHHAARLAPDVVVISDSPFLEPGQPSLPVSARGLLAAEVVVEGPRVELHSGEYGGAVANPATVLARLLADLHDADGRVTIPGFYDGVEAAAPLRRLAAAAGFDYERFRAAAGVPALAGERGMTTLERLWARPTLEVHGLAAGWARDGIKAIVPARARAAIGCRLVGEQEPERIGRALAHQLTEKAPATVRVTVRPVAEVRPWMAPLDHPAYGAARRAFEAAFGVPPVLTGGGGTLGILPLLAERFGVPILLMGFGSPGESAHGPDEWLSLDHFHRGRLAAARLLAELAAGAG